METTRMSLSPGVVDVAPEVVSVVPAVYGRLLPLLKSEVEEAWMYTDKI